MSYLTLCVKVRLGNLSLSCIHDNGFGKNWDYNNLKMLLININPSTFYNLKKIFEYV